MTPRIVNVIELNDNVVIGIDTFVIPKGVEPHSKEEQEIVDVAEKLFKSIAKENGMDDEDGDECLENGFYEGAGYKVCIHWSNENTHLKTNNNGKEKNSK